MYGFECVVCGQIKWRSSSLCKGCFDKVLNIEIKHRIHEDRDHFYLFEWNEESDVFVRALVYFLKKKSPFFFHEWAAFFTELRIPSQKLYVAPPSSTEGKYNHGDSFSQALAQLFEGESVSIMRQGSIDPQKKRRRNERLSLKSGRMQIYNSKAQKISNWIFVDDVLVTGGTLKSLVEIYGLPEKILTLIYKPLEGEGL